MGAGESKAQIWWSVAGFAALLSISRQAVYKWIKRGKLTATTVNGRMRITARDVMTMSPRLYESILLADAEKRRRGQKSSGSPVNS